MIYVIIHSLPCSNPLQPEDWDTFYAQTLPPKTPYDELSTYVVVPELDGPIEITEVMRTIKSLRNGKSPGLDGISNEALKSITPEWANYLTGFFNRILATGNVPEEWSTIEIVPLLKKGDPTDPGNYRGIALISCTAKLFTSILNNRLTAWAEARGIIPECQAGFRRGRGCTDQIFSLASIINIHTRRKKGRAFVTFVDFKRCFDSIDHNLLWKKLDSLGVSGKMLRVIRNLYELAHFSVRTSAGHSQKAAVSEGVLQGEILSPLLFTLFVSDMETFFRSQGAHGLSITEKEDVILLMYADDAAILSYSEGETKKQLNILKRYCDDNRLTVNVSKTKVMIASHQGRQSDNNCKFEYNGEEVEIVKEFVYLGVLFHQSGNFLHAATRALKKSAMALGPLWELLRRSKCTNWSRRIQLFETLAATVLLYGAEVWGLNHGDVIEKLQLKFFKWTLGVSPNTPNYAVRLEAARISTEVTVKKMMLKWWIKLLNMNDQRIPRKIFLKLVTLDRKIPLERNWASQIKQILTEAGYPQLWENNNVEEIKESLDSVIRNLAAESLNEDRNFATTSKSSYYGSWVTDETPQDTENPYTALQVIERSPYWKARTTAQLRLASKWYHFVIRGDHVNAKIDPKKDCPCCNLKEPETLEQILFLCPQYRPWRENLITNHYYAAIRTEKDKLLDILHSPSEELISHLYLFISSALKMRRIILEE